MRGLLHVQNLVNCQGPRLTESFPTLRALERLLFAVDVPGNNDKDNNVLKYCLYFSEVLIA